MNIDIDEILASPAKKRVMVLINHQAEISFGNTGFLSETDIKLIVASFRTNKELDIYAKYRELFKKAQQLLSSINQTHLMYKWQMSMLDKVMLVKEIRDTVKKIESSPASENKEIVSSPVIKLLLNDVVNRCDLDNNLIPGFMEISRRLQVSLKSTIQAFKDAVQEKSFKVKAFDKAIKSIEEQQDKSFKKAFFDSIFGCEEDYHSVKIDYEQYKKCRELALL